MNIAVILAGGSGSRMGNSQLPKQYLDVYGKPILVHTIEMFEACQMIDAILVVAAKEYFDDINIYIRKFDLSKVRWLVPNGDTRQKSSEHALFFLADHIGDDDIVVIHDAARPFVTNRIIEDNVVYAKKHGAVDTCVGTSDTIIRSIDGQVIDSVPVRKELYLGQTPQSFRFKTILDSHKWALKENITNATDDCQLALNAGNEVFIVKGEPINFKITTFSDLSLMKALLKLGKSEVEK